MNHIPKTRITTKAEQETLKLMRKIKNVSKLTDHINSENNTNLTYQAVNYLKNKLFVTNLGRPNEDAKNLLRMMLEREDRRGEVYFNYETKITIYRKRLNILYSSIFKGIRNGARR